MKKITGIEIVMGKPGVGKSTYCAKVAKQYLDKAVPVWSNYPIKGCFRFDLRNDVMNYEISNGLVIIDEAGIEMDNRDWKNFSKNLLEFFKTHRHYNLRVIVSTQFWDDVDKKVRLLASKIYILYPTLFGMTHLCLKEVTTFVGISEEEQIVEKYNFKPIWLGGLKYIYKRDAWKMFDTHIRKELQQKEWEVWQEYSRINKISNFLYCSKNIIIKIAQGIGLGATRMLRYLRRFRHDCPGGVPGRDINNN
jgi:hypothetical protein